MATLDEQIQTIKRKHYEKDGVTLITVTGDRPLCILRCLYYLSRQTYEGPLQWLVVDDGKAHANLPDLNVITHIKRQNIKDKTKSFLGNMRDAIFNVKYNKILIIEDDDWYSPEYVQLYYQRLDNFDLVGEGPARYYNVQQRRFRKWGNDNRASFCQTGLKSNVLHSLFICCQKPTPFIDARLWNKDIPRKLVFRDEYHCIGIKGMPGRKGIGSGHRPNDKYQKDPLMNELEKWIGKEDTNFYREIKF